MDTVSKVGFSVFLGVVFFCLMFFEDRLQVLMYMLSRQGYSLRNVRKLVWKSPLSNPLRRRSVFNPSMIFDADRKRWLVLCRYTRGRRVGQCMLQYLLDDDVLRLRGRRYRASMLLYIFNDEFEKQSEEPVYVLSEIKSTNPLFWQGEDPKLYVDEHGKIMVQATLHSPSGLICLGQGSLARVDDKLVWDVRRTVQSRVNQKNWSASPLAYQGSQMFLSHVYPKWRWTILSPEGVPRVVFESFSFGELGDLRCTSGCRPFRENTLLTCLHSKNPYKTYLCEIDRETLLPVRMSPAFEFSPDKSYIEFCSGLEIVGDKVYFGVGINDAQFEIYLMMRDEVEKLLFVSLNSDAPSGTRLSS